MAPIIKVENLSKQYRIGRRQEPRGRLVEAVAQTVLESFGRFWSNGRPADETIWALRDVSFEVMPGEVLGIIGRNGAGKSTLLKILSRITEPTTGYAKLYGRVGSLLEVGTGFHQELTGRENIYLNGAILGMTRTEIQNRFDAIVAFAEVDRFIDTPVKRYSSGMYLRLAFAVAAHLEPEILVIDEVLAVGDAAFQKKCLGKMGHVAKEGRTVLFVSHNMPSINALCTRAIVLETGRTVFDGASGQAVAYYLDTQTKVSLTALQERRDREGTGRIRFIRAWVEDAQGNPVETVCSGQHVRLVAEYRAVDMQALGLVTVGFALNGRMGEQLAELWSEAAGAVWLNAPSSGKATCHLPRLPLNAGRYTLNVCGRVNTIIADWVPDAIAFQVVAGDFYGTGRLPGEEQGSFLFEQEWTLEPSCVGSPASGI